VQFIIGLYFTTGRLDKKGKRGKIDYRQNFLKIMKRVTFTYVIFIAALCYAFQPACANPSRSQGVYFRPPARAFNDTKTHALVVEASAYCMRHSLTSRGTGVAYGTIAVDPKIIPYYSKIYVPGYGWGRALDTGGRIKGNKIDIWFPTYRECRQWGRRYVKIKVYKP
jgi:3D (Asp-Asp-Asp) domain-containing protein